MPRGVYERKPAKKKKSVAKSTKAGRKLIRAAKEVVEFIKTGEGGRTTEIPVISRSELKSSVSATRTPDDGALVSTLPTPQAPAVKEMDVQYALFSGDGDGIDWDMCIHSVLSSFEEASARAEQEARDRGEPVYIAQVVAVAELGDVVVKRLAPKL